MEDIQGLMALGRKAPKPQMMAVYYARLTRIFTVSGSHLYNGYAWCVAVYRDCSGLTSCPVSLATGEVWGTHRARFDPADRALSSVLVFTCAVLRGGAVCTSWCLDCCPRCCCRRAAASPRRYKLFNLAKTYNKNLTPGDVSGLASSVLLAGLAVPPYDAATGAATDAAAELERERTLRMASILGFSVVRA